MLFCSTCTDDEALCHHQLDSKLPLHCDMDECNYCCILSIHTGMNRGDTVQRDTQDLSTNTHIEEDILHYSVYGPVLIAMKCAHSLWCSAGHFTSFSCGLCLTEAQSLQISVLIKPPNCPPLLCSGWHGQLRLIQFNAEPKHLWSVYKK